MRLVVIAAVVASVAGCSGSGGPTAPTTPPANVAGSYNATFTASSTCSANLPADARSLFFLATVTQTGATVQVQLLGHQGGAATLAGTVSGQTVSFPAVTFNETVGRGATLSASGNVTAGGNGNLSGSVSGTYQTPSGSSCNSTTHQLEMVKLCSQPTATGSALVPCS